ncbi:MAG: SIMPL domain-containing protein [Candidatus Poribacteria bacterium]|nr:SIMPL domain-containing protein [Candidatus Poribacteria bacterium]
MSTTKAYCLGFTSFSITKFCMLGLSLILISTLTACDSHVASQLLSSSPSGRTIHVTGSGSVTGEPDIANLNIGVSVVRPNVADAREEAAMAMTGLIDSLKANNIDEKDINTQNFSIYPQYDYTEEGRKLRGYSVNNTVRVKVRDLTTLSDVIDDAAEAGGDSIVVNSIQFMIDDTTPLQSQARTLAVKNAETKAQTLADASGVLLGKPVTITESTYFESPPIPYAAEDAAFADEARTSTPISPGELTVTVNVTVIYEIE